MDAFDWYHLLTPLALIICCANFLLWMAIKPEHRSSLTRQLSYLSYLGCALGWFIMFIAVSLKSMDLLVKFSIVGWLILLPSIMLAAGCAISQLKHDKSHCFGLALQITALIFKSIKIIAIIFAKTLQAIFLFAFWFLSRKPSKEQIQLEEEEELYKKSFYVFGEPVFGESPRNVFGAIDPKDQ